MSKVKVPWVSESVSQWQGHLLSCSGQLKITRPQYRFLGLETNSMYFSHGWDNMLFVSGVKSQNCGRVFFDTLYFRWRSSFFGLIHLWRTITPVQNLTRPISTTFSESAPKKNSKFFDLANIEIWCLAHSSFWSLCSKFFKTPVEVSDIFKIVGPSPLRSWMIQDRCRQNWCF